MNDLNRAKEILLADGCTCVLCRNQDIRTSSCRGVKPLVLWLESGDNYADFSAADKVIGKATAFLYVLLGVRVVYASVISKPALKVLTESGVVVEYDNLVENIINRQGDDVCPFESAVLNVENPSDAYRVIIAKMDEMNIPH